MINQRRPHLIVILLLCWGAPLTAEPVDYLTRIKPVLQARCYACHGGLKQEAGLRLDTAAAIRTGTSEGNLIIDVTNLDGSEVIRRVTSTDESDRMPPEGERLKSDQVADLRQWIQEGAQGPVDEVPERDPADHWSFKPPLRPEVPQVPDALWNLNPIDAFVRAEQLRLNVTPQPLAEKRLWLRRVTIDLTGLPPTLEEQAQFLADDSGEARERVVDRLLSGPQYGERWGRHWMDIWRYSDWWGLGAEVRNSQKHIWHWRDWIIESLNEDKGYDQMVREMLAADELYPNDLDRLRGTGFLARQYFKFNRTTWLDGAIEHTSKAFLGMTFNCSKCHDHKYDPISQEDYYRFRAIFEPYQLRTDMLPGATNFEQDGLPRAFDCNIDAQTFRHIRGDDRNPDSTPLSPGIPSVFSSDEFQIEPVDLPPEAWLPGLREHVLQAYLAAADRAVDSAQKELTAAREKLTASQERQKKQPVPVLTEWLLQDDFNAPRSELWEQVDGDWKYADGGLVQSRTGMPRAVLKLRDVPPQDFEAVLRYVPTGGDRWKSVGIIFDVTPEGNEVLAYLSAVDGGSKSQISYLKQGQHVYPPEAAQSRSVVLQVPHEIHLQVRGKLINVSIDGEHSLAYQLPIERKTGPLSVITFDASVRLTEFRLRELPADVVLQETKGSKPEQLLPVDQAQQVVLITEQHLAAQLAERESLQTRWTADRARYVETDRSNAPELINAAAKAEAVARQALALEALSRAELAVMQAAPDKVEDLTKKLASARQQWEESAKKVEDPGMEYASLPGALKTLESNLETEESRNRPFPQTSTGRRAALARWMTSRENPLLARVAVNHIWARHFGRPLVPTVFEFGHKGLPPTHPGLLDWLAVELMEHGWSTRHIHRLITTSRTYALSSSTLDAATNAREHDPDNQTYWHARPIRVEAQVVRDSLLFLAGDLDLSQGGPSIPVSEPQSKRRSLYFVHSHNDHQSFLSMFDDASVLECYRRAESIVPQQALALENSDLALETARRIAGKLGPDIPDEQFVRDGFMLILSAEPTPEEMSLSIGALRRLSQVSDASRARTSLIQALLNHNDFVTVR